MANSRVFRRRALRLEQNSTHPLYLLSLTGRELLDLAEISRVSRDDAGKLIGYQRPEVRRHVQEIVEYLNGDDVLFPNSLIIALSSSVRFVKTRGPQVDDGPISAGTLEIPLPSKKGAKPAWIVDGQQRALALSKSSKLDLPVPVNAFIADEVDVQRDQFLRINNTKPLPRGLISELLPEVSGTLPSAMAARKLPAALCDLLNTRPDSPFHKIIKRASSSSADRKSAVVVDTSLIKMLQESLSNPSGCLFPYRNLATGETDIDGIWTVLTTYWNAVKVTWPEAWGKPPTRSRLMHGAGIVAMGRLMDRIMSQIDIRGARASQKVRAELALIEPVCAWTSGKWDDLDGLAWDEIQNVSKHIRALSSVLIRAYIERRGGA